MNLQRVITLANEPVRLQFVAMERSLRATGCDLPLWVIPFDGRKFDLPPNAQWWEERTVGDFLAKHSRAGHLRKYMVLTADHYQFADVDLVFLRDPAEALAGVDGFVATCTQWTQLRFTHTPESGTYMGLRDSVWQRRMFNSGQFACGPRLFTAGELIEQIACPEFQGTCFYQGVALEQPGFNLLVFESGVPVTNLTLPPHNMQSTWAGDYRGEYRHYWQAPARSPYLVHYAGNVLMHDRPINELFHQFLTRAERAEWDEQMRAKGAADQAAYRRSLPWWRRAAHDVKSTLPDGWRRSRRSSERPVSQDAAGTPTGVTA